MGYNDRFLLSMRSWKRNAKNSEMQFRAEIEIWIVETKRIPDGMHDPSKSTTRLIQIECTQRYRNIRMYIHMWKNIMYLSWMKWKNLFNFQLFSRPSLVYRFDVTIVSYKINSTRINSTYKKFTRSNQFDVEYINIFLWNKFNN